MIEIKLTDKNFIKQIVKHGYFSEQIPPCFNTDKLLECIDDFISYPLENEDKKGTAPTTLSIYKNEISRRTFSLPNPKTFLKLVKYMSDNWDRVKEHAKSDNSQSPITYLHEYINNTFQENLNHEKVRELQGSKSDFIPSMKKNIILSLGYKYLLNIDISNFYNTIYTHSITWAVCGKTEAKKCFLERDLRTDEYKFADKLDRLIRNQKNNETNGILIGPYTSRIISEIIMARIDKILTEENYIFTRYVDDFKLYFRTEVEAIESVPIIERIVNEYGLNLNTAKTKIAKYPFNTISNINTTLKKALKDDGAFGILNSAAILFNNNEKGAYKYAIKIIKKEHFSVATSATPAKIKAFHEILSMLINIMLISPNLGRYIVNYLKINRRFIDNEELAKSINNELKSILDNKLQEEVLWFVYTSRELKLKILAKNLVNILEFGDDFSKIIALDLYKRNKRTYNRSDILQINKAIKELALSLENEQIIGSRWLLLYEITMHNLIPTNIFPTHELNSFFNDLKERRISFYKNIIRTEDITL